MNGQEKLNALKQIGTFAFAFFVARGYLTHDQSTAILSDLAVMLPAAGSLCTIGWSIYGHWNMVKVPEKSAPAVVRLETGGSPPRAAMVAALAIGLSALFGAHQASAQTASAPVIKITKKPPVVIKALQPLEPYPTDGAGWYYGFNVMGSAAPVTGAAVGATALGGQIGGTLGYTSVSNGGSTFWFAELIADFQNLNGSQNGLSLTGPAELKERFGFGSPLNAMLPSLPNSNINTLISAVPSVPGLPAGVTAGPSNGYVYAALDEDDISASYGAATASKWLIAPEFGVGLLTRLSNSVVVDTWAGVKLQSNAFCLGATCPKIAPGVVTGVSFKY